MSKSFDINKAKQNIDAKKPEIQESEKKLEGLSKSKKALFDARMVIEGLDIDESVKATIVESLNSSYEEVKSEGQSESKKLNDILKDDDDTRREIMDARDDTQKAIDNLEGKGSILETFGISNAFEKSKIQAEQSLQELGELQEQVTADINKIMDVGHKLDSL